jgi:histidyl-tRNA synthetase
MQALIRGAPLLPEHLDEESREHFAALCAALEAMSIPYVLNPRLVRGLDYYSRTVFEWVTDALGSQDAICSGGRYDGLVAQLGGDATPAIGFAMGIERVVSLIEQAGTVPAAAPADVYIVAQQGRAGMAALALAESLRNLLPARRVETNLGGGNFKAQFRRADRSGAHLALVLGDEEFARGVIAVKDLREERAQFEVSLAEAAARVAALLGSQGNPKE